MQKWDEGARRREGTDANTHTHTHTQSHTHTLSLSHTHTHSPHPPSLRHTHTHGHGHTHTHGLTLTFTQVCEGQEGEHRQEAFAPSQCAVKPLPPVYKGEPTRVGTHTTHNTPIQQYFQSAYIRGYPVLISVTSRNRTETQPIESIRLDE